MKLYTKEMFLIAAEKCEVSMIDAKHIMQYIDEYVNAIELPNDDEIGQQFKNHSEDWQIRQALEEGAKWMRDKLTKTKEK